MQKVAAKVQINADRTVTVQLPEGVPIGEYDAVLVPVREVSGDNSQPSGVVESTPWDQDMDDFWNQWVEEVETMPLSPQPAKERGFGAR